VAQGARHHPTRRRLPPRGVGGSTAREVTPESAATIGAVRSSLGCGPGAHRQCSHQPGARAWPPCSLPGWARRTRSRGPPDDLVSPPTALGAGSVTAPRPVDGAGQPERAPEWSDDYTDQRRSLIAGRPSPDHIPHAHALAEAKPRQRCGDALVRPACRRSQNVTRRGDPGRRGGVSSPFAATPRRKVPMTPPQPHGLHPAARAGQSPDTVAVAMRHGQLLIRARIRACATCFPRRP